MGLERPQQCLRRSQCDTWRRAEYRTNSLRRVPHRVALFGEIGRVRRLLLVALRLSCLGREIGCTCRLPPAVSATELVISRRAAASFFQMFLATTVEVVGLSNIACYCCG